MRVAPRPTPRRGVVGGDARTGEGGRIEGRIRLVGVGIRIEQTDTTKTGRSRAVEPEDLHPRGQSQDGSPSLGTATRPRFRKLPVSTRMAAGRLSAAEPSQVARERFSRAFADVLSAHFGGRWSVEWKGSDRSATPSNRNGRSLAGQK